MPPTSATFPSLRRPIDRSAASIEEAFLQAGEILGHGLASFDELNGEMTAILTDLGGEGLNDAAVALDALATQLTTISDALPRDAETLRHLAAGNTGIAKRFDTLLENIRMMTVIARSARIEAVVFGEATGLGSFTAEVTDLTQTVRVEVSRCASHHAGTTERIRRIAVAQGDLDRAFTDKLKGLADALLAMLAEIDTRRQSGVGTLKVLAGRASAISSQTGAALMALQSGDATRQRLEHVSAAIAVAERLASGDEPIPETDRAATLAATCHLQGLQIQDLSATFDAEVSTIDGILVRLGVDTLAVVEAGEKLMGDAAAAGTSFLCTFRARLAEAARFVATCDLAQREVEDAMILFRSDVAILSRTIADLSVIIMDLIVVGINAGLRAARVGTSGRSLMVIADELKRLAGVITAEATHLVTDFHGIEASSHRLGASLAGGRTSANGDAVMAIAALLGTQDGEMTRCLAAMKAKALTFEADLQQARHRFRDAMAGNAELTTTAVHLAALVEASGVAAPYDGAATHLATLLWPHYTMVRERDLHMALLGGPPPPAPASAERGEGFDLDDLLFDAVA